jgi:hypothetical protein
MKSKSKKIEKVNKHLKKEIKKSRTKSKVNKKSKKQIIKMQGAGEMNINRWDLLSNDEKNSLIEEANPYNNRNLKRTIEEVKNLYSSKYNDRHLYDFIFSKDSLKIIKIWDHNVNEPNSITGGLTGIHLYTIYENGKYQVIGKFIRN